METNPDRRRFLAVPLSPGRRRRSAGYERAPAQIRRRQSWRRLGDQAGDQHFVRPAEADRRRPAQCRLRRGRSGRRSRGHPAARLALRHPQLRRCRAAAGAAGYRVIVPYLRGYGTTRFLSERHRPQRPAGGAGARHHRPDGCAEDREGDHRRLRLGRAHGRHHRGALAGALQGAGLGQRLSDRQPGGRQDAAAAEGRAAVVVPVLFRHRARPRRLRQIPARFRQADLAARLAEMEFRRRHLRPHARRRSTIPTTSRS